VPQASHQAYFRTSRGRAGIDPAHARLELEAVFGAALTVREVQQPFRLAVDIALAPEEIARLGARLGYCLGITSVRPARDGETARPKGPEPWAQEVVRIAGTAYRLTPVAVPAAPPTGRAKGTHRRRNLSVLDARFIANVSGLRDGGRVLDPFAGAGTLADALRARDLEVTASDLDGAAVSRLQSTGHRAFIADASRLPFKTGEFDGVVTEPPYRAYEREAVLASVAELARVTRTGGVLTLFVTTEMVPALRAAAAGATLVEELALDLRRDRLEVTLLRFRRP